MKIGYVRVDKAGPSPLDQQRALKVEGFSDFGDMGPVYVDGLRTKKPRAGEDPLPNRTEAIKALCSGDVLIISNAGRLGTTRDDLLRVLGKIGRAGASVLAVAEGVVFTPVPEVFDAAEFVEAATRTQAAERTAKARRALNEFGGPRGKQPTLKRAQIDALRPMWTNPEVRIDLVEAKSGVKRRTLYRMLGSRGNPIAAKRRKPSQ